MKTKVENNREMIIFSKFLATIKIDVPIKLDMKALVREEPNEEELRKIFEELEFRTLIDRVLKKSSSASPSSVAPDLFHQARFLLKITVRFKAICLKNLRATDWTMKKIESRAFRNQQFRLPTP